MTTERRPQTPSRPAWKAISRTDSSAVAMRSVAAALRGEPLNVWEIADWQRKLLRLVGKGGKRAAIAAVERFIAASAIDPSWADQISTDDLVTWAVSLYDGVSGPFDAIIVGAPNGGVAHLATALGVPFLSQHFVSSYRDSSPLDDVETYQTHGAALAGRILPRNTNLAVTNHYDPLHDRFLVKYVNHIRYKLLKLPKVYQHFIDRVLKPGGTIFYVDCHYPWLMYLMGDRHWFQVGGLGAVTAQEFVKGRPEIAALQKADGTSGAGHWGLKSRLAFEMPESEWGTLPPLREDVERFARDNNYRFFPLDGGQPEFFSRLAFRVWQRLLTQAQVAPQGVLLETFTQVAPWAVRNSALLPVWLPWNCTDSVDFLHQMQPSFPADKPVLWMPLPNFVETFDTASWDSWLTTLNGHSVLPLGMSPALYPADPSGMFAVQEALQEWVEAHPSPVTQTLPVDALLEEFSALRRRN